MNVEKKWDTIAREMKDFHQKEITETGPIWSQLLYRHLHTIPGTKILDVGCGTGFFSILLAQKGYEIVAIDQSQSMLEQAKQTARSYGLTKDILFFHKSAEHTSFADASFDAIVSRGASWLFMKPEQVYREWFRLLRPGGTALNFDANYLLPLYDPETGKKFQEDERLLVKRYGPFNDCYHEEETMAMAMQLPLAKVKRPAWDAGICTAIGFDTVECETDLGPGLLDAFSALRYRSLPLFLVKVTKAC